jgi:hypothetical protein
LPTSAATAGRLFWLAAIRSTPVISQLLRQQGASLPFRAENWSKTMVSNRPPQPLIRYALPFWASMALICALLPAALQAQWGMLLSPWFWAVLAMAAWRLRQPRPVPTRRRQRRHRGATPRPRRLRGAAMPNRQIPASCA